MFSNLRFPFLCVAGSFFMVGCTNHAYELFVEVRYSIAIAVPNNIELCKASSMDTDQDVIGGKVTIKQVGQYNQVSDSFLIFEREYRWAIAAEVQQYPSQVFVLPINKPQPADWSDWRDPSYVISENSFYACLNFLDNNQAGRSTNLPAEHFQLRYRIIARPEVESWTRK